MAVVYKLVFLVSVILAADFCTSTSLSVGTSVNGRLAFYDSVKLSSRVMTVRTKNVFYNGNDTIKGITAVDMTKTSAKASITAGGVGFTFTNIKLKSERGQELNYQIQIFV